MTDTIILVYMDVPESDTSASGDSFTANVIYMFTHATASILSKIYQANIDT